MSYRFNLIPVRIPVGFFFFFQTEIDTVILRLIQNYKGHRIRENILEKEHKENTHFPISKYKTTVIMTVFYDIG